MKNSVKQYCWLFSLLLVVLISCSVSDVEEVNTKSLDFSVTPDELNFTARGGNGVLNINSSMQWEIINTDDWVVLSKNEDSTTAKVSLKARINEDTISRITDLTVISDGVSKKIQITQKGMTPPISEEFSFAIPPDSLGMSSLSAVAFSEQINLGWNLGNSLEAIGGETAWGNPVVTKELIAAVKAAGFDAVRIPVAWSKFSNESTFTIDAAWTNRVEEVVSYVLENDMYAVLNIHWDGGWMQPTYEEQDYVNTRLKIMWDQIATHFRDYGDHLLFAGTNEVMVEGNYNTPTEEYYTVQNSFNQTFVDAVRSTGGKNVFRYLVVQGFNTNINHTVNFAEIPEDVRLNRLLMEVHYYDPYNFALNENSTITQWGDAATDADKVENWANEAYVTEQMQKMKANFIDNGVGVILGEYGAISRTDIPNHNTYLKSYLSYVTKAASDHGIVAFYWDNGDLNNHGFAIFDRNTATIIKPELIEGLVESVE
ncbi:cellulase family glycosylhydrolase [Leeuwenhoekiella marinoflava]|uniref:cellulase family glycosylhydrolase n=1 Tax=Leeuwenhoekiella marinoflava TaxID=988 RepID=UPI0030036312